MLNGVKPTADIACTHRHPLHGGLVSHGDLHLRKRSFVSPDHVAQPFCTVMKKHLAHLSLTALIFVVGGCATYDRTEGMPPLRISAKTPERIILKTEGASGQSFSAILIIDGSRREISGVTPAEFPLECVVLVGEATRVDGDGSFHFVIERRNGRGRFYTPPVSNLRFRYYSGAIEILTRQ